ncbi:uncharacterized protein LTR77_005477 [Saxophila tyrrhenica]|uniref:MaoC-like domain-containing protein n=1 Tax=Saxophila tyrrhenica TaxID=1690608 RepID=A0AAV9P8K7_9PEZI|nr:hypothetical protein LTR77_005477 [Saxophila tyrrhenica]
MSAPGAGHEFKPYPVAWNKRDCLLFANSIGGTVDELQFLYELHPSFSVFPTYPILLPFKHEEQDVIDFYAAQSSSSMAIPGAPKLDPKRVVDGERAMTFYEPLPTTSAGRKFEIRGKCIGIYDKGKPGTVVESQNDLVDAESGEVYARMTGSGFYVAQGGWGGPKGPKAPNYNPPEGKEPDAVYEQATSAEMAHLYRLNGDYNPLHATPEPGKQMGFGGAIMHGLYSWNTSCHSLLKTMGGSDPKNIKEFAARFASPVLPGDTLVVQMWKMGEKDGEGFEEVRFVTTVKKTGKVCLSNGRAKVKVVGQKENRTSKL